MKKMITMAMIVFSMTAFAQQQEQKSTQPVKKEFKGRHKIKGNRMNRGDLMIKKLDLTEAQQVQYKELRAKQRAEKMELHKKHQSETQAVLTPEQREKMQQMREQRKQKMEAFKAQAKTRQQQ